MEFSRKADVTEHHLAHWSQSRAVCKQCSRRGFEVGNYQQYYHLWQVAWFKWNEMIWFTKSALHQLWLQNSGGIWKKVSNFKFSVLATVLLVTYGMKLKERRDKANVPNHLTSCFITLSVYSSSAHFACVCSFISISNRHWSLKIPNKIAFRLDVLGLQGLWILLTLAPH